MNVYMTESMKYTTALASFQWNFPIFVVRQAQTRTPQAIPARACDLSWPTQGFKYTTNQSRS